MQPVVPATRPVWWSIINPRWLGAAIVRPVPPEEWKVFLVSRWVSYSRAGGGTEVGVTGQGPGGEGLICLTMGPLAIRRDPVATRPKAAPHQPLLD